jgi:hypothetical protein
LAVSADRLKAVGSTTGIGAATGAKTPALGCGSVGVCAAFVDFDLGESPKGAAVFGCVERVEGGGWDSVDWTAESSDCEAERVCAAAALGSALSADDIKGPPKTRAVFKGAPWADGEAITSGETVTAGAVIAKLDWGCVEDSAAVPAPDALGVAGCSKPSNRPSNGEEAPSVAVAPPLRPAATTPGAAAFSTVEAASETCIPAATQ